MSAPGAPQDGGRFVGTGQQAAEVTGEMSRQRGCDDDEISLGDLMRGERATLGKSLLDVQRELKIKAAYIAAIENADPGAFETPGFIAGYVRSYARYLGLDPDRAFERFRAESGFRPAHRMAGPGPTGRRPSLQAPVMLAADRDIFADRAVPYAPPRDALLSRIEPGAVGSIAVLIALIGAVGWGGWSMLQEMQRVTLAPVDDAPGLVADIDPLAPADDALAEAAPAEAGPPEPDALDRLYRPRALDVPVLVARDGPIAALDPEETGALAEASLDPRRDQVAPPRFLTEPDGEASEPDDIDGAVMAALSEAGVEAGGETGAQASAAPGADDPGAAAPGAEPDAVQVVADPGDGLVLVAVRPAWVRVRAADGTVVLEKILETGETYPVARTEEPATLRTGNAGAIYFSVGGQTFGPAGDGPSVASDVALSPEAVAESFAVADLDGDPDLARMVRVAEATPNPTPGSAPEPAASPAADPAATPGPTAADPSAAGPAGVDPADPPAD